MQRRRLGLLLRLLVGLLGLLSASTRARAVEPIKVGISTRSMPCSFYPDGQWQGSFYETWQEVAVGANLPYEVVSVPNFRQLLEMGQSGQIDVAVGCINMTPARLAKY